MHKQKQRTTLEHAFIDNAELRMGLSVTPGTGVIAEYAANPYRRARLKLTGFVVSVTAANDYGGTKLCDLPNSNLMILGAIVDLQATAGGGFSTLANLDLAIGTVTTASAAFSNAGEDNIVPKIDSSAGGVVDGASGSTEVNVFLAAGTNALFVNVATGNIATDGTVTLDGYIDVIYLDLGKATS